MADSSRTADGSTAAGDTRRPLVLVMDDEEVVLQVAKALLERSGCRVVTTRSGEEAITAVTDHLARGEQIDVAVLDLAIRNGMGGREAVGALRRLDPALAAIAATGNSSDAVFNDAPGHGFDTALAKPYRRVELEEAIQLARATRRDAERS